MIFRLMAVFAALGLLAGCASDAAKIRAAHWVGPALHVEANSLGFGQLTGSPTIRFYISVLNKDQFRELAPYLYGALAKSDDVAFKVRSKYWFGTYHFSQGLGFPNYQIPTAEVTYDIWSKKEAAPAGYVLVAEAKERLKADRKRVGFFQIYSCGAASDFSGDCEQKF
jgi:hypothetical protein